VIHFKNALYGHYDRVPSTRTHVVQVCRKMHYLTNIVLFFHGVVLRSYLCHCVWSVITANNLTPEKRDNNTVYR